MKFLSFSKQPKYSDHLDTIIALITNLAYSKFKARTPSGLSRALSITESEITFVLEKYKSLFRKSPNVSKKTGKPLYALHLRHARRWIEEAAEDTNESAADDDPQQVVPPLDVASVNALLDFVIKKADHESRTSLGLISAWVAASASLIVAIVAILFKR
jgi:hypothetical protein